MSVTGKVLHKKIQSLRADLSTGLTSEILDKVCDDPTTQPFLKWFCDNVSRANILSKDELYLKKKLQHTEEWLNEKELNEALEEATRDNPEILKLINLENEDTDDAPLELETLREICKIEEEYIVLLKDDISNFKELGYILEDDIEQETNRLEKEQIEMVKAFNDCSIILEEFDTQNCLFSKDTEQLLHVYSDTAESKGIPILWIQMPIDLFIKQTRLYKDYVDVLVKGEFNMDHREMEAHNDSDYKTLPGSSEERQIDEQMQELTLCKLKLTNSKFEEVDARLRETSYNAMAEYAHSIYNNGDVKTPEKRHLTEEILDLTRRRNILEENVTLSRERQLTEAIERYVETATSKVLERAMRAGMKQKEIRLNKLKSLLVLTREHGHAHSDLLCVLMDMQFHSLKEISEFVADARHYLTTEYSLSSTRSESMRQQQEVYETLRRTVLYRSTFNKLFISLISGNDVSPDALSRALVKYDELIASNNEKKRDIFENYLDKQINVILSSEKALSCRYEEEISSGVTTSFASLYYELNVRCKNTLDQLGGIQTDLTAIRNTIKEKMRNNKPGLNREKEILWQRFLADPDTLRRQYEETKYMADRSHFGKAN